MGIALYNIISPLVSVVIPVYNGERFIVKTIRSVLEQTYKEVEVIVVDDASSDRTEEKVRSFTSERVKYVGLAENRGVANARNVGTKMAQGKYLCFLDADDLWRPEKLSRQIDFMERTGAAFSFTGYEFADAEARPNGKVVHVPERIDYVDALKNTTISTITVMFDMQKLAKEDVMMPDVPSEDTATWWNVLKKVDCAYGLDEALSIYRRGGKSLSSNKFVAVKRIWGLYRKQEKLNVAESMKNFLGYAWHAVGRRV